MAVCQLQRPHARASLPASVRRKLAAQASPVAASQRLPSFHSRHSAFCGRSSLPARLGTREGCLRQRNARQGPVAGLWFRSSQAPGSAAASAAAAHAAAILSVPLWQHAAQSAVVVVATLALAVTVSKFLIINSGKLEAGEVCLQS